MRIQVSVRMRARARTRGVRQTAGGVSRRGWKFADGMFSVREDGEGRGRRGGQEVFPR